MKNESAPEIVKLFPGDLYRFKIENPTRALDHFESLNDIVSLTFDSRESNICIKADKDSFATFSLDKKIFVIYPKILTRDAPLSAWARLTGIYFLNEKFGSFGNDGAMLFGSVDNQSPFDLLYYQVLRKIKELTFRIRTQRYQEIEEEASTFKGRVNFRKSLSKFGGLQHRFITNLDEAFVVDPLAPLIRGFIKKVQSVSQAPQVLSLCSELDLLLNVDSVLPFTRTSVERCRSDISKIRASKNEALQIIEIFLQFLNKVDAQTDLIDGFSLNMDQLFQDLLLRILKRMATGSAYQVKSGNIRNDQLTFSADGRVGNLEYDHVVRIQPDIYFMSGDKICSIADAKYKAKVSSQSNKITGLQSADIYQMLTYCSLGTELNKGMVPKLSLVYPMRRSGELFETIGSIALNLEEMFIGSGMAAYKPQIDIVLLNIEMGLDRLFQSKEIDGLKTFISDAA